MNKKQLERRAYAKPECAIIEADAETFICTSVVPDAPQSVEDDWDGQEDVDGGTIEF